MMKKGRNKEKKNEEVNAKETGKKDAYSRQKARWFRDVKERFVWKRRALMVTSCQELLHRRKKILTVFSLISAPGAFENKI